MTKIDNANDTKIKKKDQKLSFPPVYLYFFQKIVVKMREKNSNLLIARVSFFLRANKND